MPADMIGTNVVMERRGRPPQVRVPTGPRFREPGAGRRNQPSHSQDAVRRLLEAMQERSVTVAGKTHILERPFFVLATQNPLEMEEGTYPLPEARARPVLLQIAREVSNRFGARVDPRSHHRIANPARRAYIRRQADWRTVQTCQADSQSPEAQTLRHRHRVGHPPRARRRHRDDQALSCAMDRAREERRPSSWPPRSARSSTTATMSSREDVCAAVRHPALRHRLILNFEGQAENIQPDEVVADALDVVVRQALAV